MESFHWVTGTLTMVLALGMTRLLATCVSLFRARERPDGLGALRLGRVHFYPLLEFSWALQLLATLASDWTFQHFLALLGLAIVLFVASALILPRTELQIGESLRTSFERDGRLGAGVPCGL